jgi:ion channel-forming bestrophin family protein
MHIGKSYKLSEFLHWTRRRIHILTLVSAVPVALYQLAGQTWIALPWFVVGLLGTATSFIVGFKNAQTYGRTLEAQQVWTAIAAGSRHWGLISRDFTVKREASRALVYRHLAWLTALRYQLRGGERVWESADSHSNAEYQRKFFTVPERETPLDAELKKYLDGEELSCALKTGGKATRLMGAQSQAIRQLLDSQDIVLLHHAELQRTLRDFVDQQSRLERIKNFPYPRQYAIINTLFVWSFALLVPFGMVGEFDRLNAHAPALLAGHMAWFAVPFSLLVSWMYISLDQVGESTENPFEGGANDVPMAQVCRLLEIELRETLGETDLPSLSRPVNNIIL